MGLFKDQEARRQREQKQEIDDCGDFLLTKAPPKDIAELAYLSINHAKAKCETSGKLEELHVFGKLLEAQLAIYNKLEEIERTVTCQLGR